MWKDREQSAWEETRVSGMLGVGDQKRKKKKRDRQDWQAPEVVLLPGSTVCLVARQHRLSQKREGRSERKIAAAVLYAISME